MSIDIETLANCFKSHAGYTSPQEGENQYLLLVEVLRQLRKGRGQPEDLHLAEESLLKCFVDLNRWQQTKGSLALQLTGNTWTQIVSAIAAINVDIQEAVLFLVKQNQLDALTSVCRLSWRLSSAWSAVLDGDIEDIAEHLSLEESARDLS